MSPMRWHQVKAELSNYLHTLIGCMNAPKGKRKGAFVLRSTCDNQPNMQRNKTHQAQRTPRRQVQDRSVEQERGRSEHHQPPAA